MSYPLPYDRSARAKSHWRVLVGCALGGALLVVACNHFIKVGPDDTSSSDNNNDTNTLSGPPYDGGPWEIVTDGGAPTVAKASCTDSVFSDTYTPRYHEDPAVVSKAQTIISGMSLAEKADQMRGTDPGTAASPNWANIFRTNDNTNKGVRGFLFRDGPRGVNLLAELPNGKAGYSTTFPVPVARGAAFDLDLEYRIGKAIGDETIASGHTMLLAPTVNILRHPAWGRAQETYGEDSFLLGRLGSALVTGVQTYLPACAKHYAGNNIENGRGNLDAVMDEQTLQEVYGRHFQMIVQDGGVACIMAAYNLINHVKSTQNKHLLTEMLRDQWGFQGFVLSDWWAMPPGAGAATTDTLAANATDALQAGLDMELPWSYNYKQIENVAGPQKPIGEDVITESALRIIKQKVRFNVDKVGEAIGLAAPTTTLSAQGSIENNQDHITIAHEAAVKSMVLLKNQDNTLPIKRSSVHTVAVIGADVPYALTNGDPGTQTGTIHFATDPRLGDLGSSRVKADPAKSTGPFDGIKAVAGNGINVVSGNSASLADSADFVVVVAGLTPEDEGEEYTGAGDRTSFALDDKNKTTVQNTLIANVVQRHKPMVVVLEGGSVIDMPWRDSVPAIVMAWYPGMDGGRALGELLFGDANFSGKLPITWPVQWNDEPAFTEGTTSHMDYFLGYRYFDQNKIAPLYPFGSGLSYTTFEYRYLEVACSDVTKNGVITVRAHITNTGTVKGDEVAFLWVSFPGTKVRRSVKELKSFHRVTLDPGQTKSILLPLRVSDLKYWDTATNQWQVASGPVQIMVGPNGGDSSHFLTDTVTVN